MVQVAVALLFLIAAPGASDAAAACNLRFIKFVPGEIGTAQLLVKSGESCSIRVRSALGGSRKFELRRRPAYGVLTLRGAGFTYEARRGFVGKDRFEYARHTRDPASNSAVTAVVTVEVTVNP